MILDITGRAVPSAEERQRLFNQMITPNISKIRRYVAHMSFPDENADDNLQEVLIALFRSIHLFDPSRGSLAAWSCVVARSVLSRLRLPQREGRVLPVESLDFILDGSDSEDVTHRKMIPESLRSTPDALPPVAPLTLCREAYPDTYDALQSLSALQRRVLLLVAEGWTAAEAATELRLSPANVRQLLCRARQAMRASLAARLKISNS